MLNSILSKAGAQYMCLDIENFYLTMLLNHYEYMEILLALFPELIKTQYNLNAHALNRFVYLEMCRTMWGLP